MFDKRIKKLKENLKKEKLDAVFISSVSNISYLSGFTNFSKDEREAYIFVGQDFAYIITDGRYSEAVKIQVPHLKLFERSNGKSSEELFKKHKKEIKTLGIEEDNLTVLEHKVLKKHFKNLKHFNINNLRSIKNNEELGKIEKACKLGDLAFNFILKKIKVGVSEKEIAGELEKFIKDKGAEFSFPAIVAFGRNSSVPHHQTGNTKLKDGGTVLLDLGVKVDNYCSDMTRTIFFGKPSKEQKEIYRIVLEAQQKAVEFLNKQISGASLRVKSDRRITGAELDKVAREYIKLKGFPDIPHSLGHGIGLEIHESPHLSPKSKEELKMGMVFSIEPGIYIEGFGGVRIEDLYVLEKDGLKQLTTSSREIIKL